MMIHVIHIGTIFELVNVYRLQTPPEYEVNMDRFNGGLQ
jgi:hypothetical protein